jgi:hypothetical protein
VSAIQRKCARRALRLTCRGRGRREFKAEFKIFFAYFCELKLEALDDHGTIPTFFLVPRLKRLSLVPQLLERSREFGAFSLRPLRPRL